MKLNAWLCGAVRSSWTQIVIAFAVAVFPVYEIKVSITRSINT